MASPDNFKVVIFEKHAGKSNSPPASSGPAETLLHDLNINDQEQGKDMKESNWSKFQMSLSY